MHYSQVMELAKLTKAELMLQCEQQGITNYKSKSKDALIKLLEHKASIEKNIDNKSIANPNPSISVENMCGLEYLKTLDPNSIDLILTDPPYIISKSTGLDKHYNNVKYNEANDINEVKSEAEWTNYKLQNALEDDTHKSNYIKYGSIYGKKYCVKTDYGSWDSDFTLATLEKFIELYYSKLKKAAH